MKSPLHRTILVSACLLACPMLVVSQETTPQNSSETMAAKSSVPAPPTKASEPPKDRPALIQTEVKRLLLLMDSGKDGKISKQEFVKFTEAEFDRLDKEKTGVLNVKELESNSRVRNFATPGK